MEEMQRTHKEPAWGWLNTLIAAAPRIRHRPKAASPKLVVTPWSGRSPSGWSA